MPLTLVSLEPLVIGAKIPARTFASLNHRLVRLQLTSPLGYINNAQLIEPRFFQLCRHNTICGYSRLKSTIEIVNE